MYVAMYMHMYMGVYMGVYMDVLDVVDVVVCVWTRALHVWRMCVRVRAQRRCMSWTPERMLSLKPYDVVARRKRCPGCPGGLAPAKASSEPT